jgi:hypothetical protein
MAKAVAVKIEEASVGRKTSLQEILDGMSHNERLEWIEANAYSIKQNEEYRAPLSEEEINDVKSLITKLNIEIQELEDEKKDFMDAFRPRLKSANERREIAVREARLNERVGKGTVYYVPMHELGMTYKVVEGGFIVGSRPMQSEERQMNLLARV